MRTREGEKMGEEDSHDPKLLALDTGGTMTDSFIVDETAEYTVGKAQTTPNNEAEGVFESVTNGLGYWNRTLEDSAKSLQGAVYGGTAMLNRLLEREGDSNIGVITNKGFEDTHRFGRGIQSWVGKSYSGRLHAREHEHQEPLVPRENIKGVGGRIHTTGAEIAPLYEEEVREAIHELLDKDVRLICVCLLYSYQDDSHEKRIKEIATEIIESRGMDIPVWLSANQNPVRGELPRMNSLLIEAYAVEPSRQQLYNVRDVFEDAGSDAPFRVMSSAGGTVSPEHDWLVETMLSGPIGGIFGGEFLSDELGIDNLVCSDVGGTSFDVGLITDGHYPTRWDEALAQYMVNIPMTAMDTIGSGTGSYVRIDRTSERIEVGPDSAGHKVGVANTESEIDTVTVTDCTALLGYVNPDFFLGGNIPIDLDEAHDAVKDQLAEPLGKDVSETARGVLDVVERDMANELQAMVLGLGYSPENYQLVSYGGGGPLHAAGYTRELDFEDVLIPEWAAAFSAFGCACTDYSYRYDQTVDQLLEPDFENDMAVALGLTQEIESLREQAEAAFERDGIPLEETEFKPGIRMQYAGMLEDLEVSIPQELWEGGLDGDDLQQIVDRYERKFERIFKRAAKSTELGYLITTVIGQGVAPSPDPTIPDEPVIGETPPEAANKGVRDIYWEGSWHSANIWRMKDIQSGNVLDGPCVVEAPATTFLIPPGFEAELDEHRIYHLRGA